MLVSGFECGAGLLLLQRGKEGSHPLYWHVSLIGSQGK